MKNDAEESMKAACRDETDSSLCGAHSGESRASEEVGQSEEAEEEGSIMAKLRKIVSKPLIHIPSLSLDNPASEDGVLRRPYENGAEDGRDPSPDRNDSDSISAYEDASAETPELQDRIFPGEADASELPHDSEEEETLQVDDCETQDPRNESCVVS